ncbi:MAG TPA: glycosyltransferase [Desulfomonilaceae bacterium]|nr:glycosyltransferase [Desulfomonilaceae bacterium]
MIRVLNVIGNFSLGGIETQVLHMLKTFDRRELRIDVCHIMPSDGDEGSVDTTGSSVLRCPRSTNFHDFAQRFSRLISGGNYDVVHSNFDIWSGPILHGARRSGVPVRIAQIHSLKAEGHRVATTLGKKLGRQILVAWGRTWLLHEATHILAVSRAAMEARWKDWQLYPDRFKIFSLGIDTARFTPDRSGTNRNGIPTVMCVGSFLGGPHYPNKRQDLVLRIFRLVLRTVPQARLMFVGKGPHEDSCRRLASELGISGSVDFVGVSEDVPRLLNSASVLVLMSELEALPAVLLEGQAAELGIVASDIPSHREALAPQYHKYLCPHDSVEKAAENIVVMLSNPELRSKLGAAGRDYVIQKYDARRNLRLLENFYKVCRTKTGATHETRKAGNHE